MHFIHLVKLKPEIQYIHRYLVRVMVKDMTGASTIFPVKRWIMSDVELKVSEFDSSLPFDDKNEEQRKQELKAKKLKYNLIEANPGMPKEVSYIQIYIHLATHTCIMICPRFTTLISFVDRKGP